MGVIQEFLNSRLLEAFKHSPHDKVIATSVYTYVQRYTKNFLSEKNIVLTDPNMETDLVHDVYVTLNQLFLDHDIPAKELPNLLKAVFFDCLQKYERKTVKKEAFRLKDDLVGPDSWEEYTNVLLAAWVRDQIRNLIDNKEGEDEKPNFFAPTQLSQGIGRQREEVIVFNSSAPFEEEALPFGRTLGTFLGNLASALNF